MGLDVHKSSVRIAVAEAGREAARSLGAIPNDQAMLLKKLKGLGGPEVLEVCYEAGPTGFGLQRELCERGYDCVVVAPSLTPRKSGARVKTDRRV